LPVAKLRNSILTGPDEEVDAIVHHGEVPSGDGRQNLGLLTASYRHFSKAGVCAFAGKVEPLSVGRFGGNQTAAMSYLDSLPAT
jgi:hypothetical protein